SGAPPLAEGDPARMAVAFARVLRGAGLRVSLDSVLTFTEALGAVGLAERGPVYWAGRSTLVHRPEDIATYDRAFASFWDHVRVTGIEAPEPEPLRITIAVDDGPEGSDDDDTSEASDEPTISLRWSRSEVLRHRDFAAYTSAELTEAQQLMSDLR